MAPKAKTAPAAAAPAAKSEPKAKAKGKAKKEVEDEGPKMDAPNRAEFDAAVAKIQEEIDEIQKEQKALTEQISGRSSGKDEYYAKRGEFGVQLDEFKAKIDGLFARKSEIQGAVGAQKAEGLEMKNNLQKMKKAIGYTSEAEIDERIALIEYRMVSESISLKEEKELMKEISELKKNRPKVSKVNAMQDSLNNRDTGAGLKEDIGTINEQLNMYRDGKRKVQEQLTALNEARKEQMGDLPQIIEQRDALGKKIQEKIQERNALRDAFREKEREFNNWKNEQRRLRQEKYQEEKSAMRAEYEQRDRMRKADALEQQPYVTEITLIEQTISFCKGLVADKGPAKQEEKKEISHSNTDGMEVLLPDREEEFYFVPTAGKKKGKSNKKGGAAKEGGAKPIKHNAISFKLFDQLKLSAPITTDDIPATLEKLEEQLASFQEKVKDWEVNKNEMKAKILAGEDVEAAEEAKEEE